MGSSLLQISCAEIEEVRMKIIALVENTTASAEYRCKHGLSLYIETEKHKILFDLGSDRLFAENAKKLNIDITEIDTVVISHGHKDHGGALKEFMAINSHAKIYIKKEAFEPHYIKVLGLPFHVGLDEKLLNEQQIKKERRAYEEKRGQPLVRSSRWPPLCKRHNSYGNRSQ